jgi:hypothetical protein
MKYQTTQLAPLALSLSRLSKLRLSLSLSLSRLLKLRPSPRRLPPRHRRLPHPLPPMLPLASPPAGTVGR